MRRKREPFLEFRCHLPNLIDEVLCNPTCGILRIPLSITKELIAQVAQRAAELDDPELNVLMLKLTLYDVPYKDIIKKIESERKRVVRKVDK